MLLLGIDSSGRQGSVALMEALENDLRLLELERMAGGRYSELLLPVIDGLLTKRGVAKSELGLIGVASGPGSFTGLRVGIATVKGVAEVLETPVVAVSVLEAIALRSGAQGRITVALDAQRSELFFGEYEIASGAGEYEIASGAGEYEIASGAQMAEKLNEDVASIADFAARIKTSQQRIFTPDQKLAARLEEAGVSVEAIAAPTAEDIARIAFGRFLAGERTELASLDANYLRRSDAELFSAPKLVIPPKR